MGFVLSLIYLFTYYLTPATVFGPLAAYRIQLILAGLVVLVSFPRLLQSQLSKMPQSLALVGLATAVVLSVAIGAHWMGGALDAFLEFIPNAFAFFLVALHCNTKKRLKVLVAMLVFICAFVICNGYIAELRGFPARAARSPGFEGSPYLLAMLNDSGEWFYRLRGLGEIHDPNDFAQLLVSVIPLVFIFWRPKKALSNIVLVLLPVGILLFGDFLTHSRGSLLALMAVLIVSIRPRIGTLPAAILACGLFVAAKALHFAGGRGISVDAGADRTSLWGQGLDVFKQHPIFGVGLNRLPEYTDIHRTAHNTLVVCAAELGFWGLLCWCCYLFPTILDALTLASPEKVNEPKSNAPEETFYLVQQKRVQTLDRKEAIRLGRIALLSLTGYLVAAWFLSRAYVLTLFLLGGIIEAVFQMALQNGMVAPRLKLPRLLVGSGVFAVSCVLAMYIMLRALNIFH